MTCKPRPVPSVLFSGTRLPQSPVRRYTVIIMTVAEFIAPFRPVPLLAEAIGNVGKAALTSGDSTVLK